jgi:hypothetical protein
VVPDLQQRDRAADRQIGFLELLGIAHEQDRGGAVVDPQRDRADVRVVVAASLALAVVPARWDDRGEPARALASSRWARTSSAWSVLAIPCARWTRAMCSPTLNPSPRGRWSSLLVRSSSARRRSSSASLPVGRVIAAPPELREAHRTGAACPAVDCRALAEDAAKSTTMRDACVSSCRWRSVIHRNGRSGITRAPAFAAATVDGGAHGEAIVADVAARTGRSRWRGCSRETGTPHSSAVPAVDGATCATTGMG